jgi:hypothetical protein
MNHGELKAAVSGWLKRSDMAAIIPTLIQLAEARIARELRVTSMLKFTTITANAAAVTAPADLLEIKAMAYTDAATPVRTGTVEQVLLERARISGYRPVYAVVAGDQILFGPAPDASYTISAAYYGKPDALVADADTNWLLTNHPGVYLWATLAEASPWMVDDQRVATWEAKLGQDLAALNAADKASEYSATSLSINQTHAQQVV